ncbi:MULTISPECIES: Holliday junction branch migration protein RuvA [unclassified Arsukibacterium]|uniref:Holliday junction branch migration protein RuvA n=1 Tax=unclassified Arsukibacterium TaxID=2635278 RepID=UPI000C60B9AD|nr:MULTISPECIES: Holliday junction branch migration protein RuvA [unclassified Arsukibacterium]MAA94251.1 Holliday junction branch migration protein RuvA [Rheinheimera sp.]MBM35098.1 Holliday junction branch migration protein RuvA [Rheinheimera sp.]HAW93470.1 Holliday junction branch migration protein RuvA [Candidatus Azambacteria bacterium]|tara:strand:+ start:532 stop:1149 length:618 start_codon:yes stop_codon:yes gene_type:complete
MIGRLQGVLLEKQAPDILLDVAGVGYEVQLPMTSFYQLPEPGNQLIIFTHFVVREDAQLLYGFITSTERSLFRQLIKANGVGPKLALTILSGMTAQQFVHCVLHDEISTLVKLPGVGKKTAERLVIEMRDRLKDWGVSGTPVTDRLTLSSDEAIFAPPASAEQDALSALLGLGYSQAQASKAVKLVKRADMSSEQLIMAALKSMV